MDKYPQKFTSRVFTLQLGVPTILGSLLVLFGGFVLVFILGLLLGSGYDVEERFPTLARILPDKPPAQAPLVVAAGEKPTDAKGGEGKNAASPTSSESGGKEQQPSANVKTDKGEKNEPQKTNAKSQKDDKKADAPKGDDKSNSKEERFKYTYQAASYRDKVYADKFAQKLKESGLQARTEISTGSGKSWYRVMLDHTGTPAETDSIKEKMAALGVPKLLMISKKPVNAPKKK